MIMKQKSAIICEVHIKQRCGYLKIIFSATFFVWIILIPYFLGQNSNCFKKNWHNEVSLWMEHFTHSFIHKCQHECVAHTSTSNECNHNAQLETFRATESHDDSKREKRTIFPSFNTIVKTDYFGQIVTRHSYKRSRIKTHKTLNKYTYIMRIHAK